MNYQDLEKWDVLGSFPKENKIIKMDRHENIVLILTMEGILYFTKIVKGYTAVIYNDPRNRKFKDLTSNHNTVLAISRDGFLYSNNDLQNYSGNNQMLLNQVVKFVGVKISKIACGMDFSFVVTEDERLYEWGNHGFKHFVLNWPIEDCKSEEREDEGIKKLDESRKEVISLICTKFYPVVLTRAGKIFIPILPYTYTVSHKLYHENLEVFGTTLKNEKVVQVVVGKCFVFALTETGKIYKWKVLENSADDPVLVDVNIKRPYNLWTSSSSNILVALVAEGYLVSVCFNDDGELIAISRLSFKSVWEYFCNIGVSFDGCLYSKSEKDIGVDDNDEEMAEIFQHWLIRSEALLSEEVDCDVTFEVHGNVIHAHQCVIKAHSNYLGAMLRNMTDESNNRVVIQKYTHGIFSRYIQYIYTGKLNKDTEDNNLMFLQLAHEYDEKPLLKHCEKLVINGLSKENVFMAYSLAVLLELQKLRAACLLFISHNLEDVIFHENSCIQDGETLLRCFRDLIASGSIKGMEECNIK